MDKPMQRRTGIDEKRNRHENKRHLHCGGWKNQLRRTPKSGYGQQVLYWVKGKVSHTQTTITNKFK